MSLLESLSKEIEENPELAKELLKKLLETAGPEFYLATQIKKLTDQISSLTGGQTKIWQEIRKIWQEIKAIK